MNENREIFIREYLKDFNGTRAYKAAYNVEDDKVAATSAWRLLRNVDIQKAIQEQANKTLEEAEIDVAYIVNNIKEVVERCMQKEPVMYFDKEDKEWKQEKNYVTDENGENGHYEGVWKFDATNSLKGLELLGKYKSIFSDNVKINGNIDITKQKNAVDDVIKQMKPLSDDDV